MKTEAGMMTVMKLALQRVRTTHSHTMAWTPRCCVVQTAPRRRSPAQAGHHAEGGRRDARGGGCAAEGLFLQWRMRHPAAQSRMRPLCSGAVG